MHSLGPGRKGRTEGLPGQWEQVLRHAPAPNTSPHPTHGSQRWGNSCPPPGCGSAPLLAHILAGSGGRWSCCRLQENRGAVGGVPLPSGPASSQCNRVSPQGFPWWLTSLWPFWIPSRSSTVPSLARPKPLGRPEVGSLVFRWKKEGSGAPSPRPVVRRCPARTLWPCSALQALPACTLHPPPLAAHPPGLRECRAHRTASLGSRGCRPGAWSWSGSQAGCTPEADPGARTAPGRIAPTRSPCRTHRSGSH